MENSITIIEKYSAYWKWTLLGSLAIAIGLFVGFHYLENIVIANYVRIASFISFSVTIFAGLKLMEGKRNLKIGINDSFLEVEILKKDKIIQKNKYELNKIDGVLLIPAQISIPFLGIAIDRHRAFTYQLKQNDDKSPFYLFHFGGSVLSIDKEDSERLNSFFTKYNINITNTKMRG